MVDGDIINQKGYVSLLNKNKRIDVLLKEYKQILKEDGWREDTIKSVGILLRSMKKVIEIEEKIERKFLKEKNFFKKELKAKK